MLTPRIRSNIRRAALNSNPLSIYAMCGRPQAIRLKNTLLVYDSALLFGWGIRKERLETASYRNRRVSKQIYGEINA